MAAISLRVLMTTTMLLLCNNISAFIEEDFTSFTEETRSDTSPVFTTQTEVKETTERHTTTTAEETASSTHTSGELTTTKHDDFTTASDEVTSQRSSTQVTSEVTVTQTTVATTTPTPGYSPPQLEEKFVAFHLSVRFGSDYSDDLDDPSSSRYMRVKADTEEKIAGKYYHINAEGFESVHLSQFRPGSIIADYSVRIALKSVLNDLFTVTRDIEDASITAMLNETLDDSVVDPEFLRTNTSAQLEEGRQRAGVIVENPCVVEGICRPGYTCEPPTEQESSIRCASVCLNACSTNQECLLDEDFEPACKCKSGWLPWRGGCADQNIIIGLAAGVGGVLIIIIIVVAVVISRRKSGSKRKKEESLEDQIQRHSTSANDSVAAELATFDIKERSLRNGGARGRNGFNSSDQNSAQDQEEEPGSTV